MDSAGTSSSSDKERMEAKITAANMIAQGKRNLVCGEVPAAVNQFQEACKILSGAFGETAVECAEAYFCYGQSLLDLARMETGVLGNALEGVPEDEDESSEKSSQDDQFEKPENVDDDSSKNSEEGDEEEGDEEGEEGEEEEGEGTADEGEKSQDEGEKKEGEEDPDDVSNLQLAWEMLELAKLIYSKGEEKESKIKTAESHLKLGEVSLETEQYERAIEDFNECLKIQKSVLEPEDRLIAETHYQLGLAHCFNKQYDESIEHYRTAIKVIEDKIAKLTKFVQEGDKGEKDPSKFDDPLKLAEKEISELKEILPDIKGKIEDTEEEKKNLDDLKNMAKEVASGFVGATDKPAAEQKTEEQTDKKASDISHLIRRKRKPEDEENESEAKKTKQENGSGDATAANGEKGVDSSSTDKTDVEMKKVEAEVTQQPGAVAS